MGDFNFDLHDKSIETCELLSNFYAHGYEPYFQKCTRSVVGQKESCIDNAFIKTDFLIESYRLNYCISDHYTLFLKLRIEQSCFQMQYNKRERINYKKLLKQSCNIGWNEIYCMSNLNEATEWIVNKIKYLITVSSSCNSLINKPKKSWVTDEIVVLINQKEKAYKKWKKKEMDMSLKDKYYELAKLVRNKLEKAKEDYDKKLLDNF